MSERTSLFVDEFGVEIEEIKEMNPTSQRNLQEDSQTTTFGKCPQNIMDFSFEIFANNQNIEAIYKGWQKMVNICLAKNEQSLCQSSQDFRKVHFKQENKCQTNFRALVLRNNLLEHKQKKLMIKNINHESVLASTLMELNQFVKEQCYNEILYLVFYIWKEFKELIDTKKSIGLMFKNIFPRVYNLDDWREEEYICFDEKIMEQQILKNMDAEEILKAAENTSQNLAMRFYYQADLNILLFKGYENMIVQGCNPTKQFQKFFEILCKAIFLSSANFYQYYDVVEPKNLYKRTYTSHLESFGNLLSENFFDSQDESEIPPRKLRKIF